MIIRRVVCSLTPALALLFASTSLANPLHQRISVRYEAHTLAEVIKDLSRLTGARIDCPADLLAEADIVNYSADDEQAGRIIFSILRSRGLRMTIPSSGGAITVSRADDNDEFRVKREAVYEFVRRPTVEHDGDQTTISFQTKGFCDVTVAVEDGGGRIVRHLASGVLGPGAPAPFQWNSTSQTLVWDGKDDRGQYVRDRSEMTIRVSLGLRPRFERTLYWTPHKRYAEANLPIIRSCPEGVLVYEGAIYDSVRLFDREGNYVRTVYPFPADKLAGFEDLNWRTFPQSGSRLPAKQWFRQATLLTSGDNSNVPFRGFGEQRTAHDGHGADNAHSAASAMAVQGDRIALAKIRLNRFTTAGGSIGGRLQGGELSFQSKKGGYYSNEANKIVTAGPTSAALSPDGKWVYCTGYMWVSLWGTGGLRNMWLPGVVRLPYQGDGKAEVFVGSIVRGEEGSDDRRFMVPTSVDCDQAGRVYVADYMNDRVQVYTPDGKHYKTLPVSKPAQVRVHQRTGEIYVFSWVVGNWWLQGDMKAKVPARMFRFGAIDQPGKPAEYAIPLIRYSDSASPWTGGLSYTAELDCWADEPTIWLYPGHYVVTNFHGYAGQFGGQPYWQTSGLQLLVIRDGKLQVKRDFGQDAAKAVLRTRRVAGTNRNLTVDPTSGMLYVGDGSSGEGFSWSLSLQIDPQTGRGRLIDLPFDCEQMIFDINGLAYLRARGKIARFDPQHWREVPWNYGEEHESISTAQTQNKGPGYRSSGQLFSCLVLPFWEHAPQGTFSVSARGRLVVPIKGRASTTGELTARKAEEMKVASTTKYQFQLYPGRSISGLVTVLDEHGRCIYDDAVPGLTYTHGIKIDKDDNLYALALANRVLNGEPYYNPAAGTLIKFRPKAGKILATHKDAVPVPMTPQDQPARPPDILGGGKTGVSKGWVQNAEWMFGGVGYNGEHHRNPDYGCDCCFSSFDLDYFARSFVPEVEHCSVAVLDSNGNVICRTGRYGNVDDGVAAVPDGGPGKPRSRGDDEVAIFYAPHLAVHSDRRLFVADVGNERILSIRLEYHASESIKLGR